MGTTSDVLCFLLHLHEKETFSLLSLLGVLVDVLSLLAPIAVVLQRCLQGRHCLSFYILFSGHFND